MEEWREIQVKEDREVCGWWPEGVRIRQRESERESERKRVGEGVSEGKRKYKSSSVACQLFNEKMSWGV